MGQGTATPGTKLPMAEAAQRAQADLILANNRLQEYVAALRERDLTISRLAGEKKAVQEQNTELLGRVAEAGKVETRLRAEVVELQKLNGQLHNFDSVVGQVQKATATLERLRKVVSKEDEGISEDALEFRNMLTGLTRDLTAIQAAVHQSMEDMKQARAQIQSGRGNPQQPPAGSNVT